MAVIIANSSIKPTVECPATLYIPIDGGKFAKHEFSVSFNRLKGKECTDLRDDLFQGKITYAQLLDKTVAAWGGMLGDQGQPVPYSHAERRATEEIYLGLEQAMVVSWLDNVLAGQREAAQKNSVEPSNTTSGSTAPGAAS